MRVNLYTQNLTISNVSGIFAQFVMKIGQFKGMKTYKRDPACLGFKEKLDNIGLL